MKIVKEHIYEKFTEDSDPIYDMNIGLRSLIDNWIKKINSENSLQSSQSFGTNIKMNEKYTINEDGSIDIGDPKILNYIPMFLKNGNFEREIGEGTIQYRGDIGNLPDFIKFNKCYGNCFMNVSNITSLKGCPRIVYGHFCINNNDSLKTLAYFPKEIYGDVYMPPRFENQRDYIRKKCKIHGAIQFFF